MNVLLKVASMNGAPIEKIARELNMRSDSFLQLVRHWLEEGKIKEVRIV